MSDKLILQGTGMASYSRQMIELKRNQRLNLQYDILKIQE